jgi:eukaryotic-like serine/threonine-protein kinase
VTLQPGDRLGPYEIESLIGSGGMGEVYRATDTRLQRRVAIKVLPPDMTSSVAAMERFQREARTASALNHPNICTIYDVGVSHPPFIAMELLEGETLEQRLQRGPMDARSLVGTAIGMVEGLEAAHTHGFIHRDLKPGNIFLTPHGPKLLDFGLAKQHRWPDGLSSDQTRPPGTLLTDAGVTVGTIAYMSPEQLRGKDVDARTDLFSIGLVLYEMATGRPAFAGRTSAAISGAILYERPTPPRDLVPGLPPALNDIILKALEKDRNDRYQTAGDLRADLRRLRRDLESQSTQSADGLAISAERSRSEARPGPPSAARGSIGRFRVALIAGACLLTAVGGGAYVYSRWLSRTTSSPAASLSIATIQIDQLTSTGDAERPAIAPDGKYFAYIRHREGEYSLCVRQTATATTVEVVRAEPNTALFGATVSPDSGYVDYVRRVDAQAFELWRVPFLGGAPRRLLDRVHSPIGWSADGRRFAFVRADASRGSTAVVLVNADGTGERVLAERQRPAQFVSLMIAARPGIAPNWSPNGRWLAVAGAGAGTNPADGDVTFLDADTGAQTRVALPSSAVRGLVWFDDRTLILNAALPGSALQLHQLSFPSGQVNPLTRDVNDYDSISLAADGRTLLCSRRERRTALTVVDATGRTVASGPGIDITGLRTGVTTIDWAGDRVLFGKWAWTLGSELPQQALPDAEETTATPDGKTLVFRSGNALWKADRDGGRPSLLVSGDAWGPAITPDGRGVVFLSSRTGRQSPWIVSMDGGEPRQIVDRFAAQGMDVSRDGKSLAFPSRDEEQNRAVGVVCDLDDCRRQTIVPAAGGSRVRWTPDGRALTYIEAGTQTNLWTIAVGGGQPARLTAFEDRAIVDFDWSPDGTRLVAARRIDTNDIVVLKGLRPD